MIPITVVMMMLMLPVMYLLTLKFWDTVWYVDFPLWGTNFFPVSFDHCGAIAPMYLSKLLQWIRHGICVIFPLCRVFYSVYYTHFITAGQLVPVLCLNTTANLSLKQTHLYHSILQSHTARGYCTSTSFDSNFTCLISSIFGTFAARNMPGTVK